MNRDYWINRLATEQDSIYNSTTEDILAAISDIYMETLDDVLRELAALRTMNSASNNTAISRELLLEDTAQRIGKSLVILADNVNDLLTESLVDTYSQTYTTVNDLLREAGALTSDIIPANIEDVIKTNWSGVMYSDRIWHNRDTLVFKAKEAISKGLIRGESYHNMASELSRVMDSSYSNARRLIETEVQVAQIKANIDNYKNNDIDKVEISSILDSKLCNHCNKRDGSIVSVEDGVIGRDLPPFHPSCRCTTIPVINIDEDN